MRMLTITRENLIRMVRRIRRIRMRRLRIGG